jgi:hypothetical protein
MVPRGFSWACLNRNVEMARSHLIGTISLFPFATRRHAGLYFYLRHLGHLRHNKRVPWRELLRLCSRGFSNEICCNSAQKGRKNFPRHKEREDDLLRYNNKQKV